METPEYSVHAYRNGVLEFRSVFSGTEAEVLRNPAFLTDFNGHAVRIHDGKIMVSEFVSYFCHSFANFAISRANVLCLALERSVVCIVRPAGHLSGRVDQGLWLRGQRLGVHDGQQRLDASSCGQRTWSDAATPAGRAGGVGKS